jgi:hypothetical protein
MGAILSAFGDHGSFAGVCTDSGVCAGEEGWGGFGYEENFDGYGADGGGEFWRQLDAWRKFSWTAMTDDEARVIVIEGINYAAYRETAHSLWDSDKNRLFGAEHFNSARPVYEASSWAGEDFEEKMATLLVWANVLNRSVTAFGEAQQLLENEDSVIGRVIRLGRQRRNLNQTR